MAYVLPTFNLVCNVHGVVAGVNAFRLASDCNLAIGRRSSFPFGSGANFPGIADGWAPTLLLPAATDIRDGSCGGLCDIVEVPAGTGRWYLVSGVDDYGKGFPNEHRFATLVKTWGFAGNGSGLTAPWPTPIP